MHVLFPPLSGYTLLVSWLESKWAVLENVNSSFFFFLFFGRAALIPQPGIEPLSPAVEAWSLTYWTAGEVPELLILMALSGCGEAFHFFSPCVTHQTYSFDWLLYLFSLSYQS